MGFREGEKDGERLWVAIICEMPPHCSRAAPSLHHSPTSFISSGRHWEHSTAHLPPVNIAWRLNYTHTHTLADTDTVSAKFPATVKRRINAKSVGHSFIRVGVCVVFCLPLCVCVFLWPLSPLFYPSGCICSPEGLSDELWAPCAHVIKRRWSQPMAKALRSAGIILLYAVINRFLYNRVGCGFVKHLTNVYVCVFVLTDDEWPWRHLSGQLHQKGRIVIPVYMIFSCLCTSALCDSSPAGFICTSKGSTSLWGWSNKVAIYGTHNK